MRIAAALLLLWASQSQADNWLQWAVDQDSSSWIDTDSLIERRQQVYYRYQWRYSSPQMSSDGEFDTRVALECQSGRSANLKHLLIRQNTVVAELAGHDFLTQNLAGTVHAVACLLNEQKKQGLPLQLCQYQTDINHPICGEKALIKR
jgi:hypothetical protein